MSDEIIRKIEDLDRRVQNLETQEVVGLDWDNTWTDAVHSHASAAEGGQLDWDDVWFDAVHTHASAAEGGQLDWDSAFSDAEHTHNSAAEGGTTLNLPAGSMYQVNSNPIGYGISQFLDIPALVGFWPFSSVQRSTGNVYDVSGQGRTLTYRGNPTFNFYNNLVPYIDLDGAGDYVDRADETDLDILGTETIFPAAVRGLTYGGYYWANNPAALASQALMFKGTNAAGTFAYWLSKLNTGPDIVFRVSVDGTAVTSVTSTVSLVANTWYFIWGRFIPSTSLDIGINTTITSNAAAIPASIFNSAQPFAIGGIGGATPGLYLPGRASFCFLSANALSDACILNLFNSTRTMFGIP